MTAEATADALHFEAHRPLLLGIAYRMLGTMAEAEDVVQDAYLRFRTVPAAEVINERAFLVSIVTRLCLDVLKSARVRRQQYVGPWLPEPIRTDWRAAESSPERAVELRESISLAFLVLLERLSPLERAVFLLHEVLEYGYPEIGETVGRSPAACRQLLHRAREHVAAAGPRFPVSEEQHRSLTERFLRASAGGDASGLLDLLAEDVIACSDGGGKTVSARRIVRGPDRVRRFILGVARKEPPERLEIVEINGAPAFLIWRRGAPYMAVCFDVAKDRVRQVLAVRNPDKLSRLAGAVALV